MSLDNFRIQFKIDDLKYRAKVWQIHVITDQFSLLPKQYIYIYRSAESFVNWIGVIIRDLDIDCIIITLIPGVTKVEFNQYGL